jgi:thioredoxin-like negative regulator of GroEL
LAPVLAQIAEEIAFDTVIAKCNVDECPKLSEKLGMQSIPITIFSKEGKEANRIVAMTTKINTFQSSMPYTLPL